MHRLGYDKKPPKVKLISSILTWHTILKTALIVSFLRTAYIKVRGPGIDKVCSGTMIDRQWVLTAGHCTQYCLGFPECSREIAQSEITYKVIMGEYDQLYNEVSNQLFCGSV